MREKVSIIIPAFNEEKNIGNVITGVKRLGNLYNLEIIVIDDCSNDDTNKVATRNKVKVLKHKINMGKGAAIRTGIEAAGGDLIVQIDADHQFLPEEIAKLVEPLMNGYSLTLGSRYLPGADIEIGSVNLINRFGVMFLSLVTSIFAHQRVTDVMAGFKAFRSDYLRTITIETNHFGYEAELVIKAAKKRLKILDVPITYQKRRVGRSAVSSFRHGFLVLQTIFSIGLSS